ncbi:peptidase C14 caspase catalytic subunit p20 [Burkholderia sp. H160]|nr:peptidase C14 caspase catalytic subunit p20 [Burkholderia sp. H160]
MKRALVAVGVNKTASVFPPLNAAAQGAIQMADWGKRQGFDVTLLHDGDGSKVSISDVFSAVNAIVAARVYSQLIVYFSGHGILLSPDAEVWLLSGAIANPNEAINVSGSIVAARTSAIPHIVFVSDACRSMPTNFRLGLVSPGLIFPSANPKAPMPEVDVFYATLPGDPALEVPPDEAEKSFRGLLTSCMLKALSGVPATLIEQTNDAGTVRRVVASRPLKIHLARAVPDAASAVSIALRQDPDARVESALPKYLAEVLADRAHSEPPADGLALLKEKLAPMSYRLAYSWKTAVSPRRIIERTQFETADFGLGDIVLMDDGISRSETSKPARSKLKVQDIGNVKQSVELILKSAKRSSGKTRTGFNVYGTSLRYVRSTGADSHCEVWEENGASQVSVDSGYSRNSPNEPRAALLRFGDGSGMVLSVLQWFIGTVVVERGRVSTVNYAPSRGTEIHRTYQSLAPDIDRRRAFVAIAAKHGSFRLDQEAAEGTASYLRSMKKFDPTLGLYAAYAYVQAGNDQGVLSIFDYMRIEPEPVFFDVGMLAAQRNKKLPQSLDFAPWMPMLTQGWLLLGTFETLMPDVLKVAHKHLIPGLWTTFSAEGMNVLEEAIFGGVGP